jgi:peptidoglycan/LPS O-acetylase OafA/YrhL
MTQQCHIVQARNRFWWLDGIKGISILWIVFFHFFMTYNDRTRYPWVIDVEYFSKFFAACRPQSVVQWVQCGVESVYVAVTTLGFHAVGVFLVASGFGLTYSLAQSGTPANGWFHWFQRRLLRLFPMYWLAHLVYLVSPFVARQEPIDYRFLLSFLGDRLVPLDSIFYYANPAWWFFGLLLQLYLVFPFLFRLLQKVGPLRFLLVSVLFTFATRFLLLNVLHLHGYLLQGAFFGSRLAEFAAGMALGLFARQRPNLVEKSVFAPPSLLVALVLYLLGILSYFIYWTYTFTDALTGIGLFFILAHVTLWTCRVPQLAPSLTFLGAYSYGLYLVHQPYVIYFGERMREFNPLTFTALATVIIAILTLAAIAMERGMNRAVAWFSRPQQVAAEVSRTTLSTPKGKP